VIGKGCDDEGIELMQLRKRWKKGVFLTIYIEY
jgi:hypothetical protein